MIHPTAVVHPEAQIGSAVVIGPYAVIDAGVVVGDRCWIGPHVHLTGNTRIGTDNRFHTGSVIGDAPQDLRFQGGVTGLVIGDFNTFREHVTVHRSNHPNEPTRIGSHNFLMAHSHVGHNTRLGDHVIIANGALLGGHTSIDDRAFISGNCLVHQFTRIGALALMQGGSGISKDLPPYTVARGENTICGLNIVGLRRAGFSNEDRLELKRIYRLCFRSGLSFKEALDRVEREFHSAPAKAFVDFLKTGTRGFCSDLSGHAPVA